MITDRFPLTGSAAYLLGPAGEIDSAAPAGGGAPPPLAGISQPIGEHRLFDVDSIDLLFAASDLTQRMGRQPNPMLEVRTTKELFPQLLTDPFARRVHTIGGADDFRRGTLAGCRVMEIDRRPTLVSETGTLCTWTSPRFVFAHHLLLVDLAWEMGLSRLGPPNAFAYDLTLDVWDGPPEAQVARPSIPIAVNANASAPRARRLAADVLATAVQLRFVARVAREAMIVERHASEVSNGPLGVPLLQAVHLLERRDSQMAFHSLHELNVASKEFTLYGAGDAPLTSGIARLNFRAALTGTDMVQLVLAPGMFDAFEARLSASIIERAPVTHR